VELNWADIWIDLTNITSLFKSHGRGEIVQTDEWNMTSLSALMVPSLALELINRSSTTKID
jgi:hypothetical protein